MNDLGPRLAELIAPSATEVRRAKRAVMRVLDDGKAHRTAGLLYAVSAELGAQQEMDKLEIQFAERVDAAGISRHAPAVVFLRARLAGYRAIGELANQALIIPAVDPENEEPREERWTKEGRLRVGIRHPRGGFGVEVPADRPALAPSYLRSPVAEAEPKWYLDPDVFLEDLTDLELGERAGRALREALAAFRRGLYLAAASLLGVVSEAAWYQAAERLGKPGGLEPAVAQGATAKVQKLVADQLRSVKGNVPTAPDELLAHAVLLRELRNYGVHPAEVRDDLERYFAEEECGLLILRTHNYLVRLARAVRQALEARGR